MSSADFDFLHGTWRIGHRRLKQRLVGSEDWEEFGSQMECRPILGGSGNMDEGLLPALGCWGGAIRLHDAATDLWKIYWMTSLGSAIDPPVTGSFTGGVGEFFGPDTEGGVPVLVRFRWQDITTTSATWIQAMSTDDGQTWETNWIMNFTRI